MTQLEEAKRTKEVLKSQLVEKEETCCKLESEVDNLKKKDVKTETSLKFMKSLAILEEIMGNQRSSNDKSGIGYTEYNSTHKINIPTSERKK